MLRIGRISFIHNDPAFYYLETKKPKDVDIVSASPRQLLRLLLEEKIDFASISSVSIAANSEELTVIPALSVHSKGPAMSSVVMSSGDTDKIRNGDSIAVTGHTETSARMLQAILELRKIKVKLIRSEVTTADELLKEAPFALVIGNEALTARIRRDQRVIFDVGNEWWETTNKPAVFAVSVVRKDFMNDTKRVKRIQSLVKSSLQYGYAHLDKVINRSASQSDLPRDLLGEYFSHLRLDYNQDVEDGFTHLIRTVHAGKVNIESVRH